METPYIDLHCHPALKPYGKSFSVSPTRSNSPDPAKPNSLWYYDPPSLTDKLLNYIGGLTKFSQANATALAYGNVHIVCPSLYPLEKWFVNNKLGTGSVSDVINDFALGIGKERINFIQQITDYYSDLKDEYNFYRQLHNTVVKGQYRYVLVKNYTEIEYWQSRNDGITTICFLLTIEGLHALNTGLETDPNPDEVLAHATELKNWEFKPFFVTFAHHFWNHLCGHAKSLSGLVADATDQSQGINTGFTDLGKQVLSILLDNTDNKRILIDIKHMSALARSEYIDYLKANNLKVPLIMSHAAANGLRSRTEPVVDILETGYKLLQEDINFYDEEILYLVQSDGIIGLQLDERRIASAATLHDTPHSLFRNKIMHYRSALLWNQVQHIAELLNAHGLFAWNNIAIGSDFDGIIDPLNAFWTEEEIPFLADYLERHAYNYMQGRGSTVLQTYNQISPHEIITRIFSDNALRFIKTYFI